MVRFTPLRLGVVWFIRGHWVPSGALWVSSGYFRVVGLIWVLPGVRRVHSACFGSRGCVVRIIEGRWVHPGAPWGRQVHSGSLGSLVCALLVDVFIRGRWVHSGAPRGSSGSFVLVVFTRVCTGSFQVHSGS